MKIKAKDLKPGMKIILPGLLGWGVVKLYDLPECPAPGCRKRFLCREHEYASINWVKGMVLRFHGEDAEVERIV